MSGGQEIAEHLLVDLAWKAGIVASLVVAVGLACWRIAARDRAARSRQDRSWSAGTARAPSRRQG